MILASILPLFILAQDVAGAGGGQVVNTSFTVPVGRPILVKGSTEIAGTMMINTGKSNVERRLTEKGRSSSSMSTRLWTRTERSRRDSI